jgi:hypothetical protein
LIYQPFPGRVILAVTEMQFSLKGGKKKKVTKRDSYLTLLCQKMTLVREQCDAEKNEVISQYHAK